MKYRISIEFDTGRELTDLEVESLQARIESEIQYPMLEIRD